MAKITKVKKRFDAWVRYWNKTGSVWADNANEALAMDRGFQAGYRAGHKAAIKAERKPKEAGR